MSEKNLNEISLKDIILKIKEWFLYLKTKRLVLFISAFIGAGLGLWYAYTSKPKYTADLTFVLSSNNKMSGFAGLAGQFGIDLGDGNNDDLFSGDNIIELFKSRRIVKSALFKLLPDSSQSLVNLILDKTELLKRWQKDERLQGLVPFPNDVKKLNIIQDSLVGEIHEFILKNYLFIGKIDKKLSFYKISTTSTNEIISCYLSKYIVNEASLFYIQTKTKTAKQNLLMIQSEADSLRNLLGGSIESNAAEADKTFNLNPAYQVQRSTAQRGQVNSTVLATAYGEVVKNLEIAKISLQRETPMYQMVDDPNLPLKKEKKGKIKWFIIGGFVTTLLTTAYLMSKYLYKEIMTV